MRRAWTRRGVMALGLLLMLAPWVRAEETKERPMFIVDTAVNLSMVPAPLHEPLSCCLLIRYSQPSRYQSRLARKRWPERREPRSSWANGGSGGRGSGTAG